MLPTHLLTITEPQTVSDLMGELRSREVPSGKYESYMKKDFKGRLCFVLILRGVVAEYCIREDIVEEHVHDGRIVLEILPTSSVA